MGLGDIISAAKEQIKARNVAEGRTPYSEAYRDQRAKDLDDAREQDRERKAEAMRQKQEDMSRERNESDKLRRRQIFNKDRATAREDRAKKESAAKEKKFQDDQAVWNLKQKQQYRDQEYREEQRKVQESRVMPTFGQRASNVIGRELGNVMYSITSPQKTSVKRNSQPKQRTSSNVVSRPTQRTSSLWGFTPTRSQATRSVTPSKRKPRKKSRDPLDFSFDFW